MIVDVATVGAGVAWQHGAGPQAKHSKTGPAQAEARTVIVQVDLQPAQRVCRTQPEAEIAQSVLRQLGQSHHLLAGSTEAHPPVGGEGSHVRALEGLHMQPGAGSYDHVGNNQLGQGRHVEPRAESQPGQARRLVVAQA